MYPFYRFIGPSLEFQLNCCNLISLSHPFHLGMNYTIESNVYATNCHKGQIRCPMYLYLSEFENNYKWKNNWKWKNTDIICYKLRSLVSLQQGNVNATEEIDSFYRSFSTFWKISGGLCTKFGFEIILSHHFTHQI